MITIRTGANGDIPALADIWRRSVTATHTFLTPNDIDALESEVRQGLGMLELYVAEDDGVPKGFMAMHANMIEALFLDPAYMGKKLGTRFIEYAKELRGRDTELQVDVNEQNPEALGFYLAKGFKQTGRSDIDSAGRPWPLLHLVLSSA
ncbi:MAG: acetyltransferase [Planctomycetota bacterium]|jgi:putative acetyltransferase|nr:acetyltransferase [Planctomycetota bacterium]